MDKEITDGKKAYNLLRELDLDFKVLEKDMAWLITPKDFLSEIKIVLTWALVDFSMFIWKNETIQKECKFKEFSNITDVYSFLYKYDKNNFKDIETWEDCMK